MKKNVTELMFILQNLGLKFTVLNGYIHILNDRHVDKHINKFNK